MFSKEVFNFLIKVVSSWQVIVATIALFIYLKLVLYVANTRRARSFDLTPGERPKKAKKEKPSKAVESSSGTDELGLEEE